MKLLGIKRESEFQSLKSKDVGQTTLLKFLGGNWKQYMIQEALSDLREGEEWLEATEVFDTRSDATEFRKALKDEEKIGKKVPREKLKEVASKVAKKNKEEKKKARSDTDKSGQRRRIKGITKSIIEERGEEDSLISDLEYSLDSFKSKLRTITNSCYANFSFIRCGLTREQVKQYKIPENFEHPGYQWEALADQDAQEIIESSLCQYYDHGAAHKAEKRAATISDIINKSVNEKLSGTI